MSNTEQFRALLKLQEEIDEKLDLYIELVKSVNTDQRYVIVELDGEIYQLRKVDQTRQAMDLCRKHNGFFHDYRLVKMGKPVK